MSLGNSLRCAASSRSRCNAYSSSGSLRRGLALMAWPAQRFEIAVFVCAAVSFRDDVVDRFSRARSAVAQALLADVSITLKDADADDVPLTAVATLVAAQAALMLLPPFVTVRLAVAGTVCGGAGTSTLTAGARDSCWHIVGSNKKAPRERGCVLSPKGYIFDLSARGDIHYQCHQQMGFVMASRQVAIHHVPVSRSMQSVQYIPR